MNAQANSHEILTYIHQNPVMVVGTTSEDGIPHGAAVYVYAATARRLYFVTKVKTQKYKNILFSSRVSVTIVNARDNSTLQADGEAEVVTSAQVIGEVMQKMTEIYAHSVDWLPPVAKIAAGSYQVVAITLRQVRLAKFKDVRAGSETIFKEL